ncbi:1,3-beta-glucanosyltransferase [Vermiconidia calcicola]|uniref:1,3-beta-glucanosyltransferase n=1 Tax=Vermiconidia calcicola TaxID=1690605 RepID=A0ACC3N0R5_9PEZI|nr:1,3-beta-glucanosyltransferase [Vermiconidia calcicola]
MEPVRTEGNAFWRGNERFLIKGISYMPCHPDLSNYDSLIDPLAEDRLTALDRDIAVLSGPGGLGLNTIQVMGLDFRNNHGKALNMLAEAGIYVLVKICERLKAPKGGRNGIDPNFDTAPYYKVSAMRRALRTVHELADYPNVLGFVVGGPHITWPETSKIAEVRRAAVRDVKTFLRLRGGRIPPVGTNTRDDARMRIPMLEYFTAGSSQERVDFFGLGCYSWAGRSSFQISGWQNMVQQLEQYPVPMFLSEYGTSMGDYRLWEEVDCLYSPDMTGVFSGGCVYTYFESNNPYGIVKVDEDGNLEKKWKETQGLQKHFGVVNQRSPAELYSADTKDYENWTGQFPAAGQNPWYATSNLPSLPGTIEDFLREVRSDAADEGREAGPQPPVTAHPVQHTQAVTEGVTNLNLNQ